MELWIRSQNKEMLYKTNELFLEFKICEELGIKEYYVNVNHEIFGTYKTKERALEILDEIQNLLKQEEMLHINKSLLNDLDDIEEPKYILRPVYQPRVYEMPKE